MLILCTKFISCSSCAQSSSHAHLVARSTSRAHLVHKVHLMLILCTQLPSLSAVGKTLGWQVAINSELTKDSKWSVIATLGSGDFNPSPLVFANGTTLLMWRHLARVHMLRAAQPVGPFAFNGSDNGCPANHSSSDAGCEWWHLFDQQVDARGLEDPFMFSQPHPTELATVTYHALFHDHKSFGGHAYSRDAVSWTFSSVVPYGNVVNFTDGSTVSMQRRERPHLVFDRDTGYISHLSTGVQPPPTNNKAPPSSATFQNDYTYTLIQPVA